MEYMEVASGTATFIDVWLVELDSRHHLECSGRLIAKACASAPGDVKLPSLPLGSRAFDTNGSADTDDASSSTDRLV